MQLPREKVKYLRHELRTYLTHINGYAEILKEEFQDSASNTLYSDAQMLDQEAQNLNNVFKSFFYDMGQALEDLDIDQFKTMIYGPLYIVIGHGQRLKISCEKMRPQIVDDVERLLESCRAIQDILEKHLQIDSSEYQATIHETATQENSPMHKGSTLTGRILLVEDNEESRLFLAKSIEFLGHQVEMATDGFSALSLLEQKSFDLVILDILMPGLSGYQVLEKIKSSEKTKNIPVIIVSALDEVDSVTQCLKLGAEDYILKNHNSIVFRAKINSCLEKKRIHDHELSVMAELKAYQSLFERELAEAASYVRGFLPPKMDRVIATDYVFHPSKKLGGDFFDYHWIDDDHFLFYLLDVSGHGIGAALLSVSVMNVLRSQLHNKVELSKPNLILESLNSSFLMEQQNNMYFTIWYGVYSPSTGTLLYSSAGAPPAVLVYLDNDVPVAEQLSTTDMIIGVDSNYQYELKEVKIPKKSRLYLFSDGVYEVKRVNNRMFSFKEFQEILRLHTRWGKSSVDDILHQIQGLTGIEIFEDDFSLLEIRFN